MKKHNQFLTYSGILFDFKELDINNICLEDIAHHLTNINRFGGALELDKYYSVAEHSINLCNYVLDRCPSHIELARHALLHDSTEAYMGDVVSGLKGMLSEYKELENKLEAMIFKKYNIQYAPYISQLDKRIVLDEIVSFRPEAFNTFMRKTDLISLHIDIIPYFNKQNIKEKFLRTCELLNIKD